jgi:hypothetical protein
MFYHLNWTCKNKNNLRVWIKTKIIVYLDTIEVYNVILYILILSIHEIRTIYNFVNAGTLYIEKEEGKLMTQTIYDVKEGAK